METGTPQAEHTACAHSFRAHVDLSLWELFPGGPQLASVPQARLELQKDERPHLLVHSVNEAPPVWWRLVFSLVVGNSSHPQWSFLSAVLTSEWGLQRMG